MSGVYEVLHSNVDHYGFKGSADMKFSANQYVQGNYYSEIYLWDDISVLVASQNDCFLSLFNVLEKKSRNVCKQVVELRVAPVPIPKMISCWL